MILLVFLWKVWILYKFGFLIKSKSLDLFSRTKGSHLIQAGINIYYVHDFLGHASEVTTELYARNNPEVIRKAIDKASNLLSPDTEYYDDKEKNDIMDFFKSLQ
ncbi:MAG TPA: hypothetical protein VIK78_12065 [Ruminiclostridium sp.]